MSHAYQVTSFLFSVFWRGQFGWGLYWQLLKSGFSGELVLWLFCGYFIWCCRAEFYNFHYLTFLKYSIVLSILFKINLFFYLFKMVWYQSLKGPVIENLIPNTQRLYAYVYACWQFISVITMQQIRIRPCSCNSRLEKHNILVLVMLCDFH